MNKLAVRIRDSRGEKNEERYPWCSINETDSSASLTLACSGHHVHHEQLPA